MCKLLENLGSVISKFLTTLSINIKIFPSKTYNYLKNILNDFDPGPSQAHCEHEPFQCPVHSKSVDVSSSPYDHFLETFCIKSSRACPFV